MTPEKILTYVDHTLLGVTATATDYIRLCDEALTYGVASVCVPPSRVALCAGYLAGKVAVCTVAGFPNGYASSAAKANEAAQAIQDGATEIDMVIDIGKAKEHAWEAILEDIRAVRAATQGYILKVIIETALLDQDEKIALCKVVGESGADFIKTSTGFAPTGATFEDVALLRQHSPAHVHVKAAGGIATLDDAEQFIALGATRLGTSRIVKIVQGMEDAAGY
ncbi:MAG: deoxyribose-phosphate aldolase [Defluviitaleaceae bacterium]|nr:deoxyribose-phosphate aldolase [Defluviitaleaceae bacterium]